MVSVLLLVAGESSRMGRLKALLPWNESTLLESQIKQIVKSPVSELIIVLGYQSELIRPTLLEMKERFNSCLKIEIVTNKEYRLGKTSSIRFGMKFISDHSEGLVIVGVDQPVRSKTLQRLCTSIGKKEIRIPVYRGKKGHPPFFSTHFYKEIQNITEESEGLRNVIRSNADHVQLLDIIEPQVILNLNREVDYRCARDNHLDVYK